MTFEYYCILEDTKSVKYSGLKLSLTDSLYFVVGAGVSADAYLRPFRGPNASTDLKPLLQHKKAMEICYTGGSKEEADKWLTVIDAVQKAKPTLFHRMLKMLETKGMLGHVFTQNFDGLELKAGVSSEKVTMLHGNVLRSRCLLQDGYHEDSICIGDSKFLQCSHDANHTFNHERRAQKKTHYFVPCIDYYESNSALIDNDKYSSILHEFYDDKCAVLIVAGTSLNDSVAGALGLVKEAIKADKRVYWWNLAPSPNHIGQFIGSCLGDIQRISLEQILYLKLDQ